MCLEYSSLYDHYYCQIKFSNLIFISILGLQTESIDEKELNRKLMAMRKHFDDKGHNSSVFLTAALERLDQSVASEISLLNRSARAEGMNHQ